MPFHEDIEFRDIPGDVFTLPNEVNFIQRAVFHPCARPWYVYAQTFLPAFLELGLTVVLFDVEDAMRAHGEAIVRDRHGKKGKRHGPRGKISTQGTRAQRYTQAALKTLLVVTKPLELIGFTWLLFSAMDRFFFNWQTMLDKSDFCKAPIESGPMQLSRGPGFVSIVESFVPVIMTRVRQDRGSWSPSSTGVSLPEGVYSAAFALTVIAPFGGLDNIKIRMRTPGAFANDITESDPLDLAPGEEGSMVVTHDFFYPLIGGGTLTWEVGGETIPAGIETVKGHVYCQRKG